ncbi:MAG TPA: hypothetical protein DEF51_50305, partial [Myxococcales bacterium]|nr:hypothetical protein [Myxococcales bacterium]
MGRYYTLLVCAIWALTSTAAAQPVTTVWFGGEACPRAPSVVDARPSGRAADAPRARADSVAGADPAANAGAGAAAGADAAADPAAD